MKLNILYLLIVIAFTTSCNHKNIYNIILSSKKCKGKVLNKGLIEVIYNVKVKKKQINQKDFYPVIFDTKGFDDSISGYIRYEDDILYWLDINHNSDIFYHLPEGSLKREQTLLKFTENVGESWNIYSTTYLFGSSRITLSSIKKKKNETIYNYRFKRLETLGSDYFILKQLHFSTKKGIIKIVFENSEGRQIDGTLYPAIKCN